MSKALVFIADGFEEIEALTCVDLLRRGGVAVATVSMADGLARTGAHGVTVTCDTVFPEADWAGADMLVLPGGWPGAEHLNNNQALGEKLREFADNPAKMLGAICAAPYVLGNLGLLEGRRATCYPGFEKYLEGAEFTGAAVVRDGNIVTGRGPGTAMAFALKLLESLEGELAADEVREGLAAWETTGERPDF